MIIQYHSVIRSNFHFFGHAEEVLEKRKQQQIIAYYCALLSRPWDLRVSEVAWDF